MLLCFISSTSFSQQITGRWGGDLNLPQGVTLPLVIHIEAAGDSLKATMDSPAQGATGIPVDKTSFDNNELNFSVKALQLNYKGKLTGDSITGSFTQMGHVLPLVLKKQNGNDLQLNRPQTPRPPFHYNIQDVSVTNTEEGNTLAGTLTIPNEKDFPVVVMITGSGAQDRDETLFGHKPFWVIADYFANNGIGTLRLDDRGVGGSSKGKAGATSADFATDINSAVNYLHNKGYKNIGLVGHSEGGMIAPMVAINNKNVKFMISMAGPSLPIDSLMVLQNMAILKAGGASAELIEATRRQARSLYAYINNYNGINFETDLKSIILTQMQTNGADTSNQQVKDAALNQVAQFKAPWFRYFLKYNPANNISKLKIPVLAINGEKDVQVSAKENIAAWQQLLTKGENKNFETMELPNLNHLFQETKSGSIAEYGTLEQTFSPAVLKIMKDWILQNAKR